jgi:hypothetical protein
MKTLLFTMAMTCILIFSPALVVAEEGGGGREESAIAPFSIGVQAAVETFGKEKLGAKVTGYIERDLRSLGDVVVTDAEPDLRLRVFVVEIEGGKGGDVLLGYSFVWFVTEVFTEERITEEVEMVNSSLFLERELDEKDIVAISTLILTGLERPLEAMGGGSYLTGPPDSLQERCKNLVATFDMSVLEKKRKEHQLLTNFLEKRKTQ